VRSAKTLSELAPGRASFYIAVRATNGHGRTTVAASPAVGVDSTPPVGFTCAAGTANLLGANGEFEAGIRCNVDAGPCWALPGSGDSAATGVVGGPDAPAFEGSAFLALQGALSATVGGLVVGDEYRLTLHARNLGGALHDTVVVGITGQQDTAFPVRVRPGAGAWQRFSVALRATANKVTVTLATTASAGIGLDAVSLVRCQPEAFGVGEDVFATEHHFFSSTDHIRLAWTIGDPESGVRRFRWAAGTRPGGQQVVAFTDVGTASSTEFAGLALAHGTSLFFTVVAENGAGMATTFASTAATVVDLSPAVVVRLADSGMSGDGGDRDYLRGGPGGKLHVRATARDEESSVALCDCAVGTQPGTADVSGGYLGMPVTAGAGEVETSYTLVVGISMVSPGSVLFSTVRCRNGAGLVTHATSDGIRVTPPLDAAVLDLTLVTPSETMYPRTADARVQVRAHAGRGRHSARKPTVSRRVSAGWSRQVIAAGGQGENGSAVQYWMATGGHHVGAVR